MNRLITKDKYGWYNPIDHNAVCDKLYKLEDLEEQLGCHLDDAFNLLDKIIVLNGKYQCCVLDIRKDSDIFCIHYFNKTLGYDDIEPLSNYGRTFKLMTPKKSRLIKEDKSE